MSDTHWIIAGAAAGFAAGVLTAAVIMVKAGVQVFPARPGTTVRAGSGTCRPPALQCPTQGGGHE